MKFENECYHVPEKVCADVEKPVTKTKQEKECNTVTDQVNFMFQDTDILQIYLFFFFFILLWKPLY